jgi:hypothetical protein
VQTAPAETDGHWRVGSVLVGIGTSDTVASITFPRRNARNGLAGREFGRWRVVFRVI